MNNNTNTLTYKKNSSKTSTLLELVKLFMAFLVLKDHSFMPVSSASPWFSYASIAVEFFFVVMGWFMIRGITSHQEKYSHLGLWRSWWILFKKKLVGYVVPCLIPGLICNILCLFYDGGIPNGILWIYWFVHESLIVLFIYYVIFFKTKKEKTRLIWMICLFLVCLTWRFAISCFLSSALILLEFPRAMASITLGILCAKIPKVEEHKALAWILALVSTATLVIITVFPTQYLFGVQNNNIKDAINILLFPIVIYSCVWTGFSCKPLNYIGKWSKGLYLWQMVPWTLMVIGKFYNIPVMYNGWLLMCITLGLTILEDPVRRIVKKCQHGQLKNNPKWINTKNSVYKFYWKKSTQIAFIVLAVSCVLAALCMGIVGWINGSKNNTPMEWFYNETTKRCTFYCDGLMLLLCCSPIFAVFPLNYFLTIKSEKKFAQLK